ncbi:MAG TPA: TlpA disulfide reductase family protein [Steroidobacteraceae bacterium]|jgi:peroxiredoxin|nr:TlpA disulfide reductase family protein [Steroidobacteraceae bacterium]
MNTPVLRIAGAALLVVLAIWVGAELRHARTAAHGGAGVPVAAGEASSATPSDFAPSPDDLTEGGLAPPKIPDRLPHFSLADRNGKVTPITSFEGKSLIINFWATWCAPCRSEIPLLERVHAEWQAQGVSVVGIAVDHRDEVVKFADRFKIVYPLLIGEQDALDVATAFGVVTPVFPFTVFTDRRGQVVALFVGELHKPQAEIILTEVQNLNKDLIELPAARRAIAEGLRALKSKAGGAVRS